nr:hypothetical protein [Burkholderia territorii]
MTVCPAADSMRHAMSYPIANTAASKPPHMSHAPRFTVNRRARCMATLASACAPVFHHRSAGYGIGCQSGSCMRMPYPSSSSENNAVATAMNTIRPVRLAFGRTEGRPQHSVRPASGFPGVTGKPVT